MFKRLLSRVIVYWSWIFVSFWGKYLYKWCMSLIWFFARFISHFYICVLKYYSLRLLQNCKSYLRKTRFCSSFYCILRYSPHKTEFYNLDPVIQAGYVVNLFFEEGFWCNHYVGNLCNYFPENLTRVQLMHSFHYQMRAK